MADNNALSNGTIQHDSASQLFRISKPKKVYEIPAVETRNWLMHRYYTRHEYGLCKNLIEEELTKYNGLCEYSNYLKGLILRKEGKVQESLDCFENCYRINPNNINNAKQVAKSLFLMGNLKRATEAFMEAEKKSRSPDWEIHYLLGECYVKLKQPEKAKEHYRQALELTRNEQPYLALVKLYVSEGRFADAAGVYTAALNETPESEEMSAELGLLYLRLEDANQAFYQFGTALAQTPNYTKAIMPIACMLQNHGEFDAALSKYKIATQSIPESWMLWNNVGMCFYGKQKFVAAICCLKRAHYLNPLALGPPCNLGLVFLTTGQPASAAIYLSAAIIGGPNVAMPYLLLGLALKQLNDLEGADNALEKAHSLAPQDPLVLINYAVISDARHVEDKARDILTRLNDIMAVIDVGPQVTQMASKLSAKIRGDNTQVENKPALGEDEV